MEVWGTPTYTPENRKDPCVFFGLYGLPDFFALWRHQGKRYILWAGSDITHFVNGYWLEDGGGICVDPTPLAEWINRNCESWVENRMEQMALEGIGIQSRICPSFMGNVNDFSPVYQPEVFPDVYLSVSGDNFEMYGWDVIEEIADKCHVNFHLFGNRLPWKTKHANVKVHGRLPKEKMNEMVKHMQCGLRLNKEMDGFSEITAKSLLWGQYPLVWEHFKYPHIDSFKDKRELINRLNVLKFKGIANPYRLHYLQTLNKYPWNQK
jgi:hypothetical protein